VLEPIEIDIGINDLSIETEALGLGQRDAILHNHAVPGINDVHGRLARSRGSVDISGKTTGRLGPDQFFPISIFSK